MVVNYAEACVYKIYCIDPNIKECYVGSTCNFRTRKTCHKTRCNNEKYKCYNSKVYKFIRENGGFENWDVIVLKKYPDCKDERELNKYEREWFEKLKVTLNKQVPSRTKKEYRKTSETYKAYQKEYKKKNREKQKEYRKKSKAYQEEYRKKNKEKLKAYQEEYRKKNKEK